MAKSGRKPDPRILPEKRAFLKSKREEKGYTLEALANNINYSLSHLNRVISGQKGASKEFLQKLTKTLDIEEGPAVLIGEKAWLELIQRSATTKPAKTTSNFKNEKLETFYGRKFVFNKIEEFIYKKNQGYFTIFGQPGIGKSAILAHYYHTHQEDCITYSCDSKPQLFEFIRDVCEQLQQKFSLTSQQIAETNSYDQSFLMHWLQQASKRLVEKGQKLVIAVDAVEDAHIPPEWKKGNILCLPKRLPKNVYFLLARRPFDDNQERLCTDAETFSEELNLDDPVYAKNNYDDIIEYLEGYLDNSELSTALNQWLKGSSLTRTNFIRITAEKSESNFMYMRYLVYAIAYGSYSETDFNQLPTGLDGYYHNHWQRMRMCGKKQTQKARILYTLLELETPATSIVLAAIVGQQVHTVSNFLENWVPFLKWTKVDEKKYYSIYHASFADFLREQLREEKTGLTRQEINANIDDYCSEGQSRKQKSPEIHLRKPTYQIKAERWDKIYQTLTNYKFIADKINCQQFGVFYLISDYEKVFNCQNLLSQKQEKILSLIRYTLRLSSHILNDHPDQLAGRLWGHLQDRVEPEILDLLKQAKNQQLNPWLRPLTRCFSSPESRLFQTIVGHSDPVGALTITPDGRRIISGSWDRTIKIWDLERGEELSTLRGHSDEVNSVAITPDGRRIISGSRDQTIKIWDLERGEELSTLRGHSDEIKSVAITPNGRRIISCSFDRTIKIWDLGRGEELATLRGHSDNVLAVAITPDGQRIVSSSRDGTIKIWDLEEKEELATLTENSYSVLALAITPDGRHIISSLSNNTIEIRDLERGEKLATLRGHSYLIVAVAITPDGRRVVSGSHDKTIKIWDLEGKEELATLTEKSYSVLALAITPDGQRIISGSLEGTIKMWDLEGKEELATLSEHSHHVRKVAITPDGRRMVSSSLDETIKIWDLERQEELATLRGHSDEVNSVAITPDGRHLVSSLSNGTIKIWDLERQEELATLRGHSDEVNSVAITPDGRRMVSSSSDKTIKIWDLERQEELATLRGHSDEVNSVAITPDGRRMVSSSSDKTIKIWDLEGKEELATLIGFIDGGASVAITPDGQQIILMLCDGLLIIWDVKLCKEKVTLIEHSHPVLAVAINTDGRRIVSGAWYGILKIWDLYDGKMICSFICDTFLITCSAIAANNLTIAIGSANGKIYFLKLEE